MNIKIGKFNFINSEDSSLYLDDHSFSKKLEYFFLDGKEDTIFVEDRSMFDYKGEDIGQYEKELLKNHYVLDYSGIVKNLISRFARSKAMDMFISNKYSKYNLYKNISIGGIQYLDEKTRPSFSFRKSISSDNKLILHADYLYDIVFDPFNEKVDNLEELYKRGIFDKEIKANLILIEIQYGVAPKFVEELYKINIFLENKKTINLQFDGFEKFKVDARLDSVFYLRNNEISISLDDDKDFELKNSHKNKKDLKIEKLRKILYSNNEYTVDFNSFVDISKQIATTLDDKINYKIDQIKKSLSEDFTRQQIKFEFENYSLYKTIPPNIEKAVLTIREIENNSVEGKNIYPNWYTKEMRKIIQKADLLDKLIENKGKEDFIEIGENLAYICKDSELKKIVSEYESNQEIDIEMKVNDEEEEEL